MSRAEIQRAGPFESGCVKELYIATAAGQPMISLSQATLIEGRGVEGDRYFAGCGTHSCSDDDEPGYEITFIEYETIQAVRREKKLHIEPAVLRRNVVTQGIALNHLVERTFYVGEAVLYGVALRELCLHLAEGTDHRLMVSLIHRGGLAARILKSGTVRLGDVIKEMQSWPLPFPAPNDAIQPEGGR